MKKLITILLLAAFGMANSFAQLDFSAINIPDKSKTDLSKMVNAEIAYADNLSSKISPMLNLFLSRMSKESEGKTKYDSPLNNLKEIMSFYKDDKDVIMVPVFIKTNSVEATTGTLSVLNGKIGTIAEDIITAHLPATSIELIAELPEVIFIDASTRSDTKLDISRTETKVDQLHNGTGISRPYKGNGVIVGVVDSGIDWKHQDFKNTSGSRIRYLWDMSGTGNPPSGYSYGTEYTKAQIDANQCQEIDGDDGGGHGTHVAGTAAGNGGALPNYVGMAPESEIIFVKGFRSGPGFASTDVLDGCNYIFQKSQQLSKPAVINLSLGGHFGSHDGTSLYEQGLSNLTGNGKLIVAAAGNEGGSPIHLGYSVAGSSYNDAYETFFELYNNASAVAADMWYSGGNISVGLAAYYIDNGQLVLIGYTPGVPPGQKVEDVAFDVGGYIYGYVTIDATGVNNPNNGANEVFVVIDSHNGQVNINNVYWSLYTYGTGTFDTWALLDGYFSTYAGQSWYKPGDDQKTVGIPSTSNKVVCVGSYVTKNQWIDINGTTQFQPGNPVIGQISSFSSMGPTRDGRLKPDIVAPGEVIIAAYSSFLTQTPPQNILQGGKHQKMQGTSMASPHVTGTVALLLEKNSSLNYDQVVAVLKNTTKKDSYTGTSPNNTYGHGKLDAYNAFVNTPGGGGGQTIILQEGFDGSFPPSGWQQQILNSSYTWFRGNPQNYNFNQIDPGSQYSALCPWVAQNQNEWLITPSFSLGSGSASIEFYAGHSHQYLTNATLKLHISTNGGSNWTQLWTAENDGQGWKWRQKIIDISAYSNQQNLKLGWQYIGNDGDLVGIDGVKLLGFVTDVNDDVNQVYSFALDQNYPNPFNPNTVIGYQLPVSGNVTIKVFDILGREVATLIDEYKPAGRYEIEFSPTGGPESRIKNPASGVYFYQLRTESFVQTKKMILLR
jgi:minor extracellular serine protease Vpr